MTLNSRERVVLAAVAIVMLGTAALRVPIRALSEVSAAASATAAPQASPDSGLIERLTSVGRIDVPILDPWGAISKTVGGDVFSSAPPVAGQQPKSMGFDTQLVPGALGAASSAGAGVYALGTGHAILVPGGPMVVPGMIVGGHRIVRIDDSGVLLDDGSVLHARSATYAAAPSAPGGSIGAVQPASSPSPRPAATPTAPPVPSATPSSPSGPITAGTLRRALYQMSGQSSPAPERTP